MQVVVTGGTGFVGQVLVRELTRAGHHVRVVTRNASRALPLGDVAVADLESVVDWAPIVSGASAVIHLAARVHVMKEVAHDPFQRFRAVNSSPTRALAEAAALAGVKRFLFLSTVKIHGEFTGERAFQPSDPAVPQDAYAASKWEAEVALRSVERSSRMEVCVVRPPLVYGPGVRGNVERLLSLINRGIPLPFGSIDNRRTMIGVRNLVGLLRKILEHEGSVSGSFLAGDTEDLSTPAFVKLLAVGLGKRHRMFNCPLPVLRAVGRMIGRAGEIDRLTMSLQADSRQTRATFGWNPPFEAEDEIRAMTIHWGMR